MYRRGSGTSLPQESKRLEPLLLGLLAHWHNLHGFYLPLDDADQPLHDRKSLIAGLIAAYALLQCKGNPLGMEHHLASGIVLEELVR